MGVAPHRHFYYLSISMTINAEVGVVCGRGLQDQRCDGVKKCQEISVVVCC